jgi:hypothetical protein
MTFKCNIRGIITINSDVDLRYNFFRVKDDLHQEDVAIKIVRSINLLREISRE